VLPGNVAYHCGKPFARDDASGKPDAPEAVAYLSRDSRKGWSL
jgi:hypothetical protein